MPSKKHSGTGSSGHSSHDHGAPGAGPGHTPGHSSSCRHEKIEDDFVAACNTGNLREAKAVMKRGVKVFHDCLDKLAEVTVNRVDERGTSNLIIALGQNNQELGDFLLSHPQINVNGLREGAADFPRMSPLHCAAHHGNMPALRRILSDPKLTTLNSRDTDGCTPLMEAVRKAQPEAVRELLAAKGVDLDTRSSSWSGSGVQQVLVDGGSSPDLGLEDMARVCTEKLKSGQLNYRFSPQTFQVEPIPDHLAQAEKKRYKKILILLGEARKKRMEYVSTELADQMENLRTSSGSAKPKVRSVAEKEVEKEKVKKEVKGCGTGKEESRKCHNCGAESGGRTKKCGGCRKAVYCGEACQLADWKTHKPLCIIMREMFSMSNLFPTPQGPS